MRSARLAPAAALAAACAGAAAWACCGTLALTEEGARAARVGLLPPWWWLIALAAGAVALAWLGRLPSDRARPLFFSLVLVLPWLPVRLPPAALAWTGPASWLVWAAIGGAMCAGGGQSAGRRAWRVPGFDDPPRAPWIAFVCAAIVYGAAAHRLAPLVPGGDEPHYLVIAQSLWRDGDLKIENNHQRGDYLEYFGGALRPDYLKRGKDGQIYSIHLPGVPALVAPALAAGGHRLVMALLVLVSAGATAAAWRAACLVTGSVAAAWFGWAAAALTAPFLLLSFTVYPDGPGAAVVMLAFAALVGLDVRAGRPVAWWLALGALPAALPWFHPRFAVLAGTLGLVFVARALGERNRAAAVGAFAVVPAASALGWFAYYYAIYGQLSPAAAYGHYTQMTLGRVPVGVLGLLADQQFGLLATAPVFSVAIAGLAALARLRRRLALEWLLVVAPYVLVTAAYHMWWGGLASPARFAGATLLLFSLPAAAAWNAARHSASRQTAAIALSVSMALTALIVCAERGAFAFNLRDTAAPWLRWLSQAADAARGAPSLFRGTPWLAFAEAGVWAVALGAAWFAARLAERTWRLRPGSAALTLLGAFALAGGLSLTAAWRLEGVAGLAAAAGQMRALEHAAAGKSGCGVSLDPLVFSSPEAALGRLRLGEARGGLPPGALLQLPGLPAGRYRMWIERPAGSAAADAGLFVGPRAGPPVCAWRIEEAPAGAVSREFELPVGVSSLALRWIGEPQAPVRAAWLQPAGRAGGDRLPRGMRASAAARYGRAAVFAIGRAFLEPEGLWTGGDTTAELVVQSASGEDHSDFTMGAGPVDTSVEVTAGPFAWRGTLAPGERRGLRLPTGAGGAVLVRIRTTPGFRPASHDPSSGDVRLLGVRLDPPAQP